MNDSAFPRVALALVAACVMSGCATQPDYARERQIYQREMFSPSASAFSRNFKASPAETCDAARRSLLSQGYVINVSRPEKIEGKKAFQPSGANYTEIEFNVSCMGDPRNGDHAVVFVSALQSYYGLKKAPTNASVGVGALGSLSLPIGSSDDSLVKLGGETISSAQFYQRFFSLVSFNLGEGDNPGTAPLSPAR